MTCALINYFISEFNTDYTSQLSSIHTFSQLSLIYSNQTSSSLFVFEQANNLLSNQDIEFISSKYCQDISEKFSSTLFNNFELISKISNNSYQLFINSIDEQEGEKDYSIVESYLLQEYWVRKVCESNQQGVHSLITLIENAYYLVSKSQDIIENQITKVFDVENTLKNALTNMGIFTVAMFSLTTFLSFPILKRINSFKEKVLMLVSRINLSETEIELCRLSHCQFLLRNQQEEWKNHDFIAIMTQDFDSLNEELLFLNKKEKSSKSQRKQSLKYQLQQKSPRIQADKSTANSPSNQPFKFPSQYTTSQNQPLVETHNNLLSSRLNSKQIITHQSSRLGSNSPSFPNIDTIDQPFSTIRSQEGQQTEQVGLKTIKNEIQINKKKIQIHFNSNKPQTVHHQLINKEEIKEPLKVDKVKKNNIRNQGNATNKKSKNLQFSSLITNQRLSICKSMFSMLTLSISGAGFFLVSIGLIFYFCSNLHFPLDIYAASLRSMSSLETIISISEVVLKSSQLSKEFQLNSHENVSLHFIKDRGTLIKSMNESLSELHLFQNQVSDALSNSDFLKEDTHQSLSKILVSDLCYTYPHDLTCIKALSFGDKNSMRGVIQSGLISIINLYQTMLLSYQNLFTSDLGADITSGIAEYNETPEFKYLILRGFLTPLNSFQKVNEILVSGISNLVDSISFFFLMYFIVGSSLIGLIWIVICFKIRKTVNTDLSGISFTLTCIPFHKQIEDATTQLLKTINKI